MCVHNRGEMRKIYLFCVTCLIILSLSILIPILVYVIPIRINKEVEAIELRYGNEEIRPVTIQIRGWYRIDILRNIHKYSGYIQVEGYDFSKERLYPLTLQVNRRTGRQNTRISNLDYTNNDNVFEGWIETTGLFNQIVIHFRNEQGHLGSDISPVIISGIIE